MRVLSGLAPAPADLHAAALALGVMDGVHQGHQAVIENARAHANGAPVCAVVFEPPPRRYFQPAAPPFRIQTSAQRARALERAGVAAVYELPFDRDLANIPAERFAKDILAERLRAAHVSVGFDFRYGQARAGDAETLKAHGAAHNFTVGITPPLTRDGEKISSTLIRARLVEGRVDEASTLLTRPWAIEGEVLHGDKRGRTIGFPTANIALGDYVRPKFGVYAVRTMFNGLAIGGVANIGARPTVSGDHAPRLETHLFDLDADLYGKTLEIELHAFLREEQKFESFEALKFQIAKDVETAKAALAA